MGKFYNDLAVIWTTVRVEGTGGIPPNVFGGNFWLCNAYFIANLYLSPYCSAIIRIIMIEMYRHYTSYDAQFDLKMSNKIRTKIFAWKHRNMIKGDI